MTKHLKCQSCAVHFSHSCVVFHLSSICVTLYRMHSCVVLWLLRACSSNLASSEDMVVPRPRLRM